MVDTTMMFLLTFCVAMISAGLAVTAYEFRRMASLQSWRNPLALPTASQMTPVWVRARAGRTR